MLEDNISSRYIYYNKEAYSKMILQLLRADIASKSKDIELSNFLFFKTKSQWNRMSHPSLLLVNHLGEPMFLR